MNSLPCALARPFIVAAVLDGSELSSRLSTHRDSCLRCQATEARTRVTGRSLRALDLPISDPPAGLAEAVAVRLDEAPPGTGKPIGLAVSGAVVVAMIIVAIRHRRQSS